jgi:hypothetical protein
MRRRRSLTLEEGTMHKIVALVYLAFALIGGVAVIATA